MKATQERVLKLLGDAKVQRDYAEAIAILERIPPEVLAEFRKAGAAHRTMEL